MSWRAPKSSKASRAWQGVTLCLAVAALGLAACVTRSIAPPKGVTPRQVKIETTGYCNCGQCCGWEYSMFGFGPPVYSSGASKGQRKTVGITASGKPAKRGTLAADPSVPFGTVVKIPGYGFGRVDDRGGAIKGNKLDLWFPSHQAAKEWGRKTLTVTIWPASP